MITLVVGDLLESSEQFIAHQANCVSSTAAGLAASIFEKYPYADVYTNRSTHSKMGEIEISGDGLTQRQVISLYSQYYPGAVKYSNGIDSVKARQEAFSDCLDKITNLPHLKSIAFPFQIGCGLAGGDWEWYSSALMKFSENLPIDTQVFLYQKSV